MKSLKNKKGICIMLIMMLAISLMTGCGNNGKQTISSSVKEGSYTATEKGFGGDVTVRVTVSEEASVSDIEVVAEGETPTIGGRIGFICR